MIQRLIFSAKPRLDRRPVGFAPCLLRFKFSPASFNFSDAPILHYAAVWLPFRYDCPAIIIIWLSPMFKKTLIASALTASFVFAAQSVQAQTIPNLVTGLFDGFTNTQLEARRGGGSRRTSSVKRTTTKPRATTSSRTTSSSANKSTSGSSYAYPSTRTTTTTTTTTPAATSTALTPTTRSTLPATTSSSSALTTSSATRSTTSTTSTTPTNQYSGSSYNNNQYGSQPYNSQYNNQYGSQYGNNQYGQYGSNQYGSQYGQYGQYNQPKQPSAALGMGATFVSSLAGAGAGVLLANMLLSPSAAAEQGTEIATPEMLADNQITELMPAVETQISDVENRLSAVGVDPATGEMIEAAAMTADTAMDKIALYEELLRLKDLEIKLLQEQVKRLEG